MNTPKKPQRPIIQGDYPLLMPANKLSKVVGIGEFTLRCWMDEGKLAYIQVGNRRLSSVQDVWETYETYKVRAITRANPSRKTVAYSVQ